MTGRVVTSAEARRLILAGEAPAGMIVDGWLDLSYCTGLKALPADLTVKGWLDLFGCTSLVIPNGQRITQRGKPGAAIAFDGNYVLTRTDAGGFVAGCRDFGDASAALAHWGRRRGARAELFTAAIRECAA